MFDFVIALILIALFVLIKFANRRNETTVFGAPYVPLEPDVVNRIMEMAKVKKGDIFYDLGSGDGRLVIAAAQRGARAYGVEIDPARIWYSRLCILLFGLWGRASIINANIFDVDLSKADVLTMYLLQETNDKLFPKLVKEVKDGSRVVGVAFNFPKWKPVEINKFGPIYGPIYLYHYNKEEQVNQH